MASRSTDRSVGDAAAAVERPRSSGATPGDATPGTCTGWPSPRPHAGAGIGRRVCSTGPTSRSGRADRAWLRLDVVTGNRPLRDYYESAGFVHRRDLARRVRDAATARADRGRRACTSALRAAENLSDADRRSRTVGRPAKGDARCCKRSCSRTSPCSCSLVRAGRSARAGNARRGAAARAANRSAARRSRRSAFVIDHPRVPRRPLRPGHAPARQPAQRALPPALRRRRADRPALAATRSRRTRPAGSRASSPISAHVLDARRRRRPRRRMASSATRPRCATRSPRSSPRSRRPGSRCARSRCDADQAPRRARARDRSRRPRAALPRLRSRAGPSDGTWWLTPGGGVDDGESLAGRGAARAVRGDRSRRSTTSARRCSNGTSSSSSRAVHFDQTEHFFCVRTERFDVDACRVDRPRAALDVRAPVVERGRARRDRRDDLSRGPRRSADRDPAASAHSVYLPSWRNQPSVSSTPHDSASRPFSTR